MAKVDLLHCFVDTNTLIHFPTFEEVGWPKHLAAKHVQLTIAPIVLAEIDSLKNDPSKKWRRDRAATIRGRLRKLLAASPPGQPVPVRPGVTLLCIPHEPPSATDWWVGQGLDPAQADDRLVASAVAFLAENPGAKLLMLTNDFGPEMKARTRGIAARDPADFLTRLVTVSEEDVKIRRLEEENRALRDRIPVMKVELVPPSEWTPIDAIIRPPPSDPWRSDEALAHDLEMEKRSCLRLVIPAVRKALPQEWEAYCKSVDRYIKELEEFLFDQRALEGGWEIECRLLVYNAGTAQATNVDTWITFPKGTRAYRTEDVDHPRRGITRLTRPERPKPPAVRKPVSARDLIRAMEARDLTDTPVSSHLLQTYGSLVGPPLFDEPPTQVPKPALSVYHENAHLFTPKIRAKDYGITCPITAFLPPNKGPEMMVGFEIHADELPDRETGTLRVSLS